jgi:hypothetical protein
MHRQLHTSSQVWNWHGPERRQLLATEVSRDFIPPCPRGFLPRRRQLLDQPPIQVRNPSHQLMEPYAANDVPVGPACARGPISQATTQAKPAEIEARRPKIAAENRIIVSQKAWDGLRSILRIFLEFTSGKRTQLPFARQRLHRF